MTDEHLTDVEHLNHVEHSIRGRIEAKLGEPPRRFKTMEELTTDEHFERIQAQGRQAPEPQFETDEYREYRATVSRAASLKDDDDPADKPSLEEMSVEDHARRIFGNDDGEPAPGIATTRRRRRS